MDLLNLINEKTVVVFGTGAYSGTALAIKNRISYYIDNNAEKWSMDHQGKKVYSPDKLLNEDKNSLVVLIASRYYDDMSKQLSDYGYIENIHFFSIEEVIRAMCNVDAFKVKIFKSIHAGERVFIIGNGPSLASQDLEIIKNEYSFGSNGIYLAFDQTNWRPNYYTINDEKVAENCKSQVENLNIPKFFTIKTMASLGHVSSVKWIFDPYLYNSSGDRKFEFSEDCSKYATDGGTVTLFNMQLAYYMGFSEIVLLGVDFNYPNLPKYSENTKTYVYNGTQSNAHFHSSYHKIGDVNYAPNLELMYSSYVEAYKFLKSKGVRVYNATRNSKLDVFPKINLDEYLKKKI